MEKEAQSCGSGNGRTRWRKKNRFAAELLRDNLSGTSGDQGKDHVSPRKRPKLEEALKPSPVAVAIRAVEGQLEGDEWRPR